MVWTYPDDFVYIDVTEYFFKKKDCLCTKASFFHVSAAVLTFKKPQAFYPLKL